MPTSDNLKTNPYPLCAKKPSHRIMPASDNLKTTPYPLLEGGKKRGDVMSCNLQLAHYFG
jgi:hypothetical protein